MKRLTTLIAGSALVLSTACAIAAPAQARSYLYALSGKNGLIRKTTNGQYLLEMTLPIKNQVTMFSDRPYRIVKPISGNELKKIWDKGGPNSFAANPPNAVLEIASMQAKVVTLTGFQFRGNQALYTFKPTVIGEGDITVML